ncbi:MAG: hypothetical protein ABIP36_05615 [Acidimicrobiales bacterium]
MVVRKLVAGSALALVLMTGTAAAQDPASPESSIRADDLGRGPAPAAARGAGNLARTGGDLDLELFAGAGLTAAGLAVAVTARQRRRRFESAPTFS